MATFTRTIARNVSNTLPAWRQAMTATDTLYYVGTNTPETAPQLLGMPTQFGSGGGPPGDGFFGAGWDVISGYSSGTSLKDVGGPFGTMVYGAGGHTRVQNQLLGFDFNQDNPSFYWWHPPTWSTSDTGGANFYYSPAEAAALVGGPRGNAARIDLNNETATTVTWDRQFPVAASNWIFPRKMTTGQMGNGVTHGFRYTNTAYIPSSVTGGDPLFLATMGAQGPFGQFYTPDGSNDTEWFDPAVLVSGQRRWPYYFRNCRTGAWTVHQWQPSGTRRGGYSGAPVGVFEDIKRVYVCAGVNNNNGWWHLDFTAGFSGHTVSAPVTVGLGRSGYANMAFSSGDKLGRHFGVGLANTLVSETKMVVYDFDAGTAFHVDLAAAGFLFDPTDEYVNFSFDAANSRVLVVYYNNSLNRIEYWSITVPDTLTNTAGWIATKRTLALADAGMASSHFASRRVSHLYGKTDFQPRLGVCFVPFDQQRMLAFRPSV